MSKDTSSQEYLDLKEELRAILISSQEGHTEQKLLKEYAEFNGKKEIPFQQMGYNSLIDLLKSMPDVARIDHRRQFIIIHGVSTASTAHIQDFVMKQKRSKKPAYGRGGTIKNNYPIRYNAPTMIRNTRQPSPYSYSNGIPFQPYSQISNPPQDPWDTHNISKLPNSTTTLASPLTTDSSVPQTSHGNSNVVSKSSATTEPKVTSFPPKENRISPLISSSSEITSIRRTSINDDRNYFDDTVLKANDAQKAQLHGKEIILLRKRVRQLLLEYKNGIHLKSIEKMYQKKFGTELSLEAYGLKDLTAFFECISDFVNDQRDPLNDQTYRLLLVKPNFIEVIKREQERLKQTIESTTIMNSKEPENSFRDSNNEIERPTIDLSPFVSSDFQYNLVDCPLNKSFPGFIADVQDPWSIHVGNKGFIPKRDRMMAELQDHYSQSSDEPIYNIPFEQIQIHVSCVFYHTDQLYYRAFIYHIDPSLNSDVLTLKLHLVDYGRVISNVIYGRNSSNVKFLHRKFSYLPCQIYECRLANISYPATSLQWPDDAGQIVTDLCEGIGFSVEIVGFIDSLYSIYIWIDPDCQQSINQILIDQGVAIAFDDSIYYAKLHSSSVTPLTTNDDDNNNHYLDERLLTQTAGYHSNYDLEENDMKHYIISIDHAYYFVKQPFTKRACLPCFEVARLLGKDETFVSNLNLIRDTEISLNDSTRTLFNNLETLNESSRCPHINRPNEQKTIVLYDLSSIRDYLLKIKFSEGDVIDAFEQEYNNCHRPGYWNEKSNSYINPRNIEIHQKNLYQQRDLLNIRREQLVSFSRTSPNISIRDEMETIDNNLNRINDELHSMESILPSTQDQPIPIGSVSTTQSKKISNMKLRDTLFRIARPIDQQFSLNVCFQHQLLDINHFPNEDFEYRLQDLYRITKNVILFFLLESELCDENERILLNEITSLSEDLIKNETPLKETIEIYNHCVKIIQHFQPIIYSHVQRTNLIDMIY